MNCPENRYISLTSLRGWRAGGADGREGTGREKGRGRQRQGRRGPSLTIQLGQRRHVRRYIILTLPDATTLLRHCVLITPTQTSAPRKRYPTSSRLFFFHMLHLVGGAHDDTYVYIAISTHQASSCNLSNHS